MNDEKLRSAFGTDYKLSAKPTPKLFIIQYSLFIVYGIIYAVNFDDAMFICE